MPKKPKLEQVLVYQEKKLHGCARLIEYIIKDNCWKCVSHFLNNRHNDTRVFQVNVLLIQE